MKPGYIKCANCFGTGTVFRSVKFPGKGTLCPVCKGRCQVKKKEAQK